MHKIRVCVQFRKEVQKLNYLQCWKIRGFIEFYIVVLSFLWRGNTTAKRHLQISRWSKRFWV